MAEKYTMEDLRALVEYLASNPAFLFPELTAEEKAKVVEDVLEQYEEEKAIAEGSTPLVIDLLKETVIKLKAPE